MNHYHVYGARKVVPCYRCWAPTLLVTDHPHVAGDHWEVPMCTSCRGDVDYVWGMLAVFSTPEDCSTCVSAVSA
jgi:hypothetical protein